MPRPREVRLRNRLIGHVPTAFAAVDDVDQPRVVAFVAVVVVGEQIAVLVEGEFLRIAQAAMDDFELGTVLIAAEHRSGTRADERLAFLAGHVEAAISDAEIEFAVRTENQPVEVVAEEGDVHPEAG